MILVLTRELDRLKRTILPLLEERGSRFICFDTTTFPRTAGITFGYNGASPYSLSLHLDSHAIDLAEVTTVWCRRPAPPVPDPSIAPEDQSFVVQEARQALSAMYYCLADRFWVNHYEAGQIAERKPYQLQAARAAGLDVPRTIVTNSPEEALAFFESCKGDVVYKGLTPYARNENGQGRALFTNRLTRERFLAHLEQIRLAPCIFQEYVPKQSELRVTVVGPHVFTSEIDSQSIEGARDDWRRTLLTTPAPQRAFTLPEPVAARAHDLMQRLGLVFGCLDFVRTPDNRFVFLEINPHGQWEWVERATGLPIAQHLADLLVRGRP